jgi:hypothetical protein
MAVAKNRFEQRRDQLADRRRRRLRRIKRLLSEVMNDLPAEVAATRKTPSYQVQCYFNAKFCSPKRLVIHS